MKYNLSFKSFLALIIGAIFVIGSHPAQAITSKTYSITEGTQDKYSITGIAQVNGAAKVNWYSPEWRYRQKIIIHKEYIGEELTDFPVLIRLNNTSIYNHARSDGYDIVLTDKNNTKLSYDREDNTTIWVKVPKLTPTEDTVLYLYYGNPTATDQSNPTDVWSNGYAGVYHLSDNPEGSIVDSTKNKFNGTSSGGMVKDPNSQNGKIGKALQFDGNNDQINLGTGRYAFSKTTVFSGSTWMKTSSTTGTLFSNWTVLGNSGWQLTLGDTVAGTVNMILSSSGGGSIRGQRTNATVNDNQWHHVAFTYDGSNRAAGILIYIDGASQALTLRSDNDPGTLADTGFVIGARSPSAFPYYFTGDIDDVRVSTVTRSGSWIRAEYANQSNSEDFLQISGEVESNGSTNGITTIQPKESVAFTTFNSFTANTGGVVSFELSNNGGKSWQYYTKQGWIKTTSGKSSVNDIQAHIKTFPKGEGKFIWRAYLTPPASLNTVSITYTGGTTRSTGFPGLIPQINTAFSQIHNRIPTYEEWKYWADRLLKKEKTSFSDLLGAIAWQKSNK